MKRPPYFSRRYGKGNDESNIYIREAKRTQEWETSSRKSLAFMSFKVRQRYLESCLYITFIFFFL